MSRLVARVLLGALAPVALAQEPPTNGPRSVDPGWHALVHARVVCEPGRILEDVTIVVRDGSILALATGAAPPAGARIWDCTGLCVFPALIEPHVPIDVPDLAAAPERHWNPQVRAEARATGSTGLDAKLRSDLRRLGFAVAATAPKAGILRGRAAVTLLHDDDERTARLPRRAILVDDGYQSVSMAPAGFSDYPGSLMGAIALVRQTFADAAWRQTARARGAALGASASLDALMYRPTRGVPFVFHARDELDVLRAAKVMAEFDLHGAVLASGTEFRRLPAIAATGLPLILPLDYQKAPDVGTTAEQARVSLRDLMTWEQAPTNPRRVAAAGVRAALTSDRLEDRAQFPARVREAIAHGLDADLALTMLTTIPAELLGIADRAGTLAPGKLANFVLVRGGDGRHPYAKGSAITATWVEGKPYVVEPEAPTAASTWSLTGDALGTEPVRGTLRLAKDKVTLEVGETKVEGKGVAQRGTRLDFLMAGDVFGEKGVFVMSASVEGDCMFGHGISARGARFAWRATRQGSDAARPESEETADTSVPEALPIPFGAYGRTEPAPVEHLVVRHATLWTSGRAGTIEDGVLIVRAGKVVYAGTAAGAPAAAGAPEVDARGKHVTPGLIDCHSHTAISGGVNEGGQAVTAEVRIADVLNPDDINIYRQLAGGLTAANALHGSANPIGGQSATVKWRWGCAHPDDLRLAGAPEGIKFALGENPKRSRSREENTRYPRTRLGVDAVIRDGFTAAAVYARTQAAWRALPAAEQAKTPPPQRDLELEALAEVLAGTRFVHCHSYRQDEILALCRVAGEFGFQIGTFQHVLEGYKVADAIKTAARGASSFSDWWAYKFEVYDGIPYNGELMHRVGVSVSFNSDSSELARRMNTEAAKAVKYGGLDPHSALQFVTANPAFQLGADAHIGALVAGADADFVLWSGDPLATTTRCEATWVDGRRLFSLEADASMRVQVASERQRLIQKILEQTNRGRGRQGDRAPEGDDEADGQAYGCGECGCREMGR